MIFLGSKLNQFHRLQQHRFARIVFWARYRSVHLDITILHCPPKDLYILIFWGLKANSPHGHARAREEQKQHLLTFSGVIPPNCLTFTRCLDDASLSQVRCFLFSSAMHMCGMPALCVCSDTWAGCDQSLTVSQVSIDRHQRLGCAQDRFSIQGARAIRLCVSDNMDPFRRHQI